MAAAELSQPAAAATYSSDDVGCTRWLEAHIAMANDDAWRSHATQSQREIRGPPDVKSHNRVGSVLGKAG